MAARSPHLHFAVWLSYPAAAAMPRPDKRAVLDVLTVKRLGGLCDEFELDRAGVTRKDDLAELLARSKRASLEAILGQLKRDELKDICRALGLDDSGKEKEPIIARILGRKAAAPAQPVLPGVGAGPRGRGQRAQSVEDAESEATGRTGGGAGRSPPGGPKLRRSPRRRPRRTARRRATARCRRRSR